MLVHVTHFQNVQDHVSEQVEEELLALSTGSGTAILVGPTQS